VGSCLRGQVTRFLEDILGALVASLRTAWDVLVLRSLTIGKVMDGGKSCTAGAEKNGDTAPTTVWYDDATPAIGIWTCEKDGVTLYLRRISVLVATKPKKTLSL
jgi:hypothetical protein